MVNRSTYYKFLNHTPSARDKDNAYIRSCILALHSKYKKRLGADKLRICLRNEYCLKISTGRVYRLLKTMNLPQMSTVKPFSRKNAASSAENCTNILKQRFNPAKPNAAWVCDMTYLRAAGRFFYLCVILDLFSRKVIAYKLSRKNDSRLALDTLTMAVQNRNINPKGIIFHSDRGAQFTSKVFRDYLDSLDMIQSFSAKGHPYDNAVMESFFKYLKKEETDRHSFASFNELNLSLFEYIYGFYNSVRPHSHNNGLSPNQAEFVFS